MCVVCSLKKFATPPLVLVLLVAYGLWHLLIPSYRQCQGQAEVETAR
jgi:hypothetical protein